MFGEIGVKVGGCKNALASRGNPIIESLPNLRMNEFF